MEFLSPCVDGISVITERVNKKFTCVVDFWLDNITVGFITEFAVDTMKQYTAT